MRAPEMIVTVGYVFTSDTCIRTVFPLVLAPEISIRRPTGAPRNLLSIPINSSRGGSPLLLTGSRLASGSIVAMSLSAVIEGPAKAAVTCAMW